MTEIAPIIKGVAIPPVARRQSRRKYEFEKMQVGDMLFVPGTRNFSSYVSTVGGKISMKFRTRRIWMRKGKVCDEKEPGAVPGTGVWRIE